MIKLFIQNRAGQGIFLLCLCVLLWYKGFLQPYPPLQQDGFAPLYELLCNWISPYPHLTVTVALLLTIAEGLWLCIILYNHKMLAQAPFLPMLFYLLLMSYHHNMLTLTPALLCNIFVLWAIQQLLQGENQTLPPERIFNAMLFIGIATLFYMPATMLLIAFLMVVAQYKLYNWRDWVIMLLGLIAPYILLCTYYYMTDRLDYMLFLIGNNVARLQLSVHPVALLQTIADVTIALFMTWCLLTAVATGNESTSMLRQKNNILMMPAVAGLLMIFFDDILPLNTQLFAIPVAFAAARYFLSLRKRLWLSDTILTSLILLCIIAQ